KLFCSKYWDYKMTKGIIQGSVYESFNTDLKSKIEKQNKKIVNRTLIVFAVFHLCLEVAFNVPSPHASRSVLINFFISRVVVMHCADLTKKRGLITQSIIVSIVVFVVRIVLSALLGVLHNGI
ncbi:MAG: hypothetical protein NC548_64195, partial [Lachnospiraceae bacterium]|nr:hypothetical protein [Lachnospiraceae bacterium]